MTTALEDARAEVAAHLRGALADVLPGYRIHDTQPPKPAAPEAWLTPFGLAPDTIAGGAVPVVVATGTITALVDGERGAQITATDVLQCALWQAINGIGTPTASTVGYIDVGGPLLFGVTLTFTLVLDVATICPLDLTHAA